MHGDGGTVDVQLPHDTGLLAGELGAESMCGAALAESQETDEDVLFGVFVGEERLPARVGGVVAAHKLDLGRSDFVLDFVDADFAGSDVAAAGAEVFHPGQGQFAQVAVLHARGDQGHGDIALHPVDTGPWWYEGEDSSDNVD